MYDLDSYLLEMYRMSTNELTTCIKACESYRITDTTDRDKHMPPKL